MKSANQKRVARLPSGDRELTEEALSEIYKCAEQNIVSAQDIAGRLDRLLRTGLFDHMVNKGYVAVDREKVTFTREGQSMAASVIRRQRLSERLLADVLGVGDAFVDVTACQWEHILSEEVTDAICTLLGHPSECPHGLKIPSGQCCKDTSATVSPVISSLYALPRGAEARIAYIMFRDNPEAERVLALGMTPGTPIKVIERFPTFVVEAGKAQAAFDEEIAKSIFVRVLDKKNGQKEPKA